MPNDQENLFTPPAETDLPNVDLGVQPEAPQEGDTTSANEPYRAVGEEDLGEMHGPQQVSAAEELATSSVGRVDVRNGDPSTATVVYPGLETPTPTEAAAESGLPGSETPAAPADLPTVEGAQIPVTHYEENSGESVAPPVIGAAPAPEQPAPEDQNFGQ